MATDDDQMMTMVMDDDDAHTRVPAHEYELSPPPPLQAQIQGPFQ